MEHKVFRAFDTKILDEDQGIVESIVAVMGNLDEGGDIIHPSAFRKTLSERGLKVRVLDNHKTDSVMRVIGKPLNLRELEKMELPPQLTSEYPEATGALWAKTQFLLDTPEGKGAFSRIKSGAVEEWSIGYDAMDYDYSTIEQDGKSVNARNLRTLKLYEYSPCIFAMNMATGTLSAKAEPAEGKPYRVIPQGNQFCVFKLDEDGNPTDKLKCYDSEEAAADYARALYTNVEDAGKSDVDKAVTRTSEDLDTPGKSDEPVDEEKAGRILARRNADRIQRAIDALNDALKDAGILQILEEEDEEEAKQAEVMNGPQEADVTPTSDEAGPKPEPEPAPDDKSLQIQIQIEQQKLKMLEV